MAALVYDEAYGLDWLCSGHINGEPSGWLSTGHNYWTEGELVGILVKKGQRHESLGQTAVG